MPSPLLCFWLRYIFSRTPFFFSALHPFARGAPRNSRAPRNARVVADFHVSKKLLMNSCTTPLCSPAVLIITLMVSTKDGALRAVHPQRETATTTELSCTTQLPCDKRGKNYVACCCCCCSACRLSCVFCLCCLLKLFPLWLHSSSMWEPSLFLRGSACFTIDRLSVTKPESERDGDDLDTDTAVK